MANKAFKILGLAAALVLAASAYSQGGRGGGFGGQRGGGMQFGNMANSETVLLQRADVQKDIKLTEEQKTKLTALQQEMAEKMRAQFEGMRGGRGGGGNAGGGTGGTGGQAGVRGGGGGFDFTQMREQMEAMQKEANDKAKAILTEEQWKRLGQIKVQLAGAGIFLEDEFGKKLGLKANQKIEINRLIEMQGEANSEIYAKMRDENADRAALMAEVRKNDQILRDEVEKLLNDEQRKTLADLEGPKFTPDPNIQNNPFGGGRGGGGGGGGRGGATTGGGGGGSRGGTTGGGL